MSSELAIKLEGVGKAYKIYADPAERLGELVLMRDSAARQFWSLQDVSFEVAHGETVGIVGSNGAGKSTLLQIIAGALKPTTGQLTVNGAIAPMIELGASFNPEFSGRENITLAADVMGLDAKKLRGRLQAIIDFADLGAFLEQPLKHYSSGMYARLAFAVFAHLDADIMIIDEILSVGDASFNQKCMRRIREFKERGAILFTSHDTQALVNLCDRVVWLERGMVRDIGAPRDICRDYMAAAKAAANASDFQIGGRRQPPPPAIPHASEAEPAPESADPWHFDQHTLRAQGARLRGVSVSSPEGDKTQWQGGDELVLTIDGDAGAIGGPMAIVFDVRDRLGQILLSDRLEIAADERPANRFSARFAFVLPHLQPGEYVIGVTLLSRVNGHVAVTSEMLDASVFQVDRSYAFGLTPPASSLVRLEVTS